MQVEKKKTRNGDNIIILFLSIKFDGPSKMLLRCLFLALVALSVTDGQPPEQIKNTIGGVYSENITLFFMNSPYRVSSDLTVETGATMTIQTGVKIYFDAGVGLKVKGSLYAVVSYYFLTLCFHASALMRLNAPSSKRSDKVIATATELVSLKFNGAIRHAIVAIALPGADWQIFFVQASPILFEPRRRRILWRTATNPIERRWRL